MSKNGTGRRSGRVGSFFFGSFIGFLLCIALIAGVGCFAYFKVSPAWLNKTFKTNIDLGSEEANNKTISNFVSSAVGLTQNFDTYTLNDLKDDFGIEVKDELFGLDITDLKTVGLSDLPKAIENKFGTISADELRNINGMNLEDMSKILDKTNVYYYNSVDDKLYKDFDGANYSSLVDFDYEINDDKTKVITKKHETPIILNQDFGVLNQVNIPLWYLPLTDALGDFTSNMGDQITLAELETDYGVELPSFFDNVDKANTTINEMEEAIDALHVADFLGYTIDNADIVWNGNTKVTGIMAIVAKETVADLSDLKSTIDETTIAEILDLNIKQDSATGSYYDDKNDNGLMDTDEEVAYVMNVIAGTNVEDLSSVINGLKVSQIFSESERSEGILSLIEGDPTVEEIPTSIESAIETATIDELITKKVIDKPDDYDNLKNDETTILKSDNVTKKKVSELTLPEMIDYCFDLINAAKNLQNS